MKFHILSFLHIFQHKALQICFKLHFSEIMYITHCTKKFIQLSKKYCRVISMLMILVSRCARKDMEELEIHFKRIEKK